LRKVISLPPHQNTARRAVTTSPRMQNSPTDQIAERIG
jgi:hypothetical protein